MGVLPGYESDAGLADVRLVASDMDRTLLADDGSMPDGMGARIEALEAAGVTFAAASGRPLYTLRDMFGASCGRMGLISDNGAAVVCRGEVVFKSPVDQSVIDELVDLTLARCAGGVPVVCGLERAYVPTGARAHDAGLRPFFHEIAYVDDIRAVRAEANKYTVYFPGGDSAAAFSELFSPAFGERLSVTCAGAEWLDVMNRGVNKSTGIARLCERLGVSTDDALALGDTDNDAEMLERVGHGYLVANAPERMEAHARFRAPSNNDRGVARVIDRLLAARAVSREEAS